MSDLTEIPVTSIEVGDRFRVDLGDVEALAESIESSGYTQPILVSKKGEGEHVLIDGGRRLAAYELLGRMLIPAIVRPAVTDDEVALLEAVTNSHRKGWTPSEAAAKAAQIEQLLAEGRLDQVGSLPTAGERRSAWVARMVGYRDRTLRDARQLVEYQATTVDGQILCDRLVEEMDSSGQVSGPHRQWRGVRQLEVLSDHDDREVAGMATAALARALDDTTVDIAAEAHGLASYADVEIKDETAGVEPGDATPDEPAAAAVSRGRGSDAESRQASEPSLPPDVPAWKDLSGAQREAMAHLWRSGSLRYSNTTTESTIYHLVADHLEQRGLVAITVPVGSTFDGRVVRLTHAGIDVMEDFATEWWEVQRRGLNLASDWTINERYERPDPWAPAEVVFDRNGGAKFRALVIEGGNYSLSQIFDDLATAMAWLRSKRHDDATPTQVGGDDDADGKGSAGPSELATEHDANAAPSADDEGESASELPATTGGARPEGWPPRAESHPTLTGMTEVGFRSSANFYAAARQIMDSILDGDTPGEAVDCLMSGAGRLSLNLTDEQLDYVLAHFDVPAPAPGPVSGSEPPAPSAGVNGSHASEGDELAPDPSIEVEGEEFGTVPATVPATDEGPGTSRPGPSSTTHLPRRKEHSSPPVLAAEMLRLLAALDVAATLIQGITPAEVDRALGANRSATELGAQFVAAIDVLTELMPGVRFVARPV